MVLKRFRHFLIWPGLVILTVAALVTLSPRPDTWAAPGQNPHRQTVPTRTPVPQPSPEASPEAPLEKPPEEPPQPTLTTPEATLLPTDTPIPPTVTLTPALPTATLVIATDTPQPAAATPMPTETPSPGRTSTVPETWISTLLPSPRLTTTLTETWTSTSLPSPPTPMATSTSTPKRANGLVPLLGFALVAILVALLALWARRRQGEEG